MASRLRRISLRLASQSRCRNAWLLNVSEAFIQSSYHSKCNEMTLMVLQWKEGKKKKQISRCQRWKKSLMVQVIESIIFMRHTKLLLRKMIMFTSFKLNINTHWCSFLKQENCSKPSGKTLPVWNINNLRLLCRRREKQFVTSTGQQDSGICCCLLLDVLLFFFSSFLLFWWTCVNGIFFCMKHRNSSTWMNRWS